MAQRELILEDYVSAILGDLINAIIVHPKLQLMIGKCKRA